MEVVYTCPVVRYWSEVLCCFIPTHMSNLEIKVTDLEKIMLKFFIKVLERIFFMFKFSDKVLEAK